jgi:hypothetical protein
MTTTNEETRIPDGLTAGEVLARAGDALPGQHRDFYDAIHDFAGLVDLEGILAGATDNDRRHCMAATVWAFVSEEDVSGSLRRKADWIESSDAGGAPLDSFTGSAQALRAIANLIDLPIDGPEAGR